MPGEYSNKIIYLHGDQLYDMGSMEVITPEAAKVFILGGAQADRTVKQFLKDSDK